MHRIRVAIFNGLLLLMALGCASGSRSVTAQDERGGSTSKLRGGSGGGSDQLEGSQPEGGRPEGPQSSDGTSGVGASGTASVGQAGSSTTAATTAGVSGVSGAAGASAVVRCAAPIDLGVRFVGRHDGCEKDAVRFAWSGSGFVAAFNGTGLSVRMRGRVNQFALLIDGTAQPKFATLDGDKIYTLASGLVAGTHTLELYRRTEASFGATSVVALSIENGTLDVAPPPPARLIEVVGDSISCGYGNEGTPPCDFSIETENHYLTYGAILARSFGAELSTIAWSGKGVVSNYGGTNTEHIPVTYDRSVPTEPRSVWSFAPQPQLVIINAGTNDFSANTDPTEAEFVAAYQQLLATIRSHYPTAYILCTVGPMLSGTDLTLRARPYIASAVQARRSAGDLNVEAYEMATGNPNPTCQSHPSLLTHAAMADELAARVRSVLGWQ